MLLIPVSGKANSSKDALLIFLGSDEPEWVEIKDKFKEWADEHVVSPNIFIIATVAHAQLLHSMMAADSKVKAAVDVVGKLSSIHICSYDGDGNISYVDKKDRNGVERSDVASLLDLAVESFITSELDQGNVVVAAPPGFYFSKQSDRHSSHFIRTEGLLSSTAAIELLAFSLLKKFRAYCDDLEHGTVRILIDSMGIWPLAQALIQARRLADPKRRYVIKSFRSYEGFSENSVASGPAFILISASTSGGLAALLKKKMGSNKVACITVLGLRAIVAPSDEKMGEAENYIYTLPRTLSGAPSYFGLRAEFEPNITNVQPGWESVRIIGERFLNQSFRPRAVRLTHGVLKDEHKSLLADISENRYALVARRRPDGSSFWAISLDVSALVERYCEDNDQRESLLRSWLTNYAVAGNTIIVHPVDTLENGRPDQGVARRISEIVRKLLIEKTPNAEVRIIDSSDLDRPTEELRAFMLNAAVIVAAPIVGDGFIFKQISAALRSVQPKGPRFYFSLAVLPESQARLQELRNDLELNSHDRAYHFKSAIALPIGKLDEDSAWRHDALLMNRLVELCDEDNIAIPKLLRERLEQFRTGNGLSRELTFFPSFSGNPLPMSPGFLLWKSAEPICGQDLGASVLMTVSVLLEACRSGGARTGETSLVSGLFQQTLIAPMTFTRFNDPAIQAAILRAAYRSELNYASSPDMSLDVQRLILRLIKLYDAPAGDALPEFLVALSLRRLTLHESHIEMVRQDAARLPGWLGRLAQEI